jgi:hypothetical protein
VRGRICIFVFIANLFFFATKPLLAQQTPGRQSPSIPDAVLGSQLIAWSQLQKPEPVIQSQSQQRQHVQRSDQVSSPVPPSNNRVNTDRANQVTSESITGDGDQFANIGIPH